MNLIYALAGGIGTFVVLSSLAWILSRRLRIVRQLSFALTLASVAAGLYVFLLISGQTSGRVYDALAWMVVLLVVVVIVKIIGLYFFQVLLQSRGVRLPALLPKVAFATAYLLAIVPTLKAAFPELDLAPLLATSAVTSLVLGLALQPILGNFFAGLVISLERPFRINDWILFDEVEARVVSITWRTTHLRTRDNDDLVVPNSRIAEKKILNYFYPHPLHMERIYVGAHYRTPPYKVKQVMIAAADRVSAVLDKPSVSVYLYDFSESSITYELRAWIEDIAEKPRIANELKSAVWEEFRRAGIKIPFPIRTLEIEPKAGLLEISKTEGPHRIEERLQATGTLAVIEGLDEGRRIELGAESMTFGRSNECSVMLAEPLASSCHLSISWVEGSGYELADLESQNGTKVNEESCTKCFLSDMDRLTVGDTVLVFEAHE
jgi:small-conductance mechanosensitive channel